MSVQEVTATYDCKEPGCTKDAKSRTGRYSYCDDHQRGRAEEPPVEVVATAASSDSPFIRFGDVARKIGSLTSVLRTRSEDGTRTTVHGGSREALLRREAEAVRRLEVVAAKLEAMV